MADVPRPAPGRRIRVQIAAGQPLLPALEAACARQGVADGQARLRGALQRAVLAPAPDAEPLALAGPLYLVDGSVEIDEGVCYAVVSWSDRGLPRVAAGVLAEAISGGVTAVVDGEADEPLEAAAPKAAAPAPPAERPRRERERPARRARPAEDEDEERVDLSAEMAELTPRPPPAAPPAPEPAQQSLGWGAAVAASRAAPAAGRDAPSPHELGFDAPPELQAGDILIHPRFGRCRVSRPASGAKVAVRRATGALIDLHLKVVQFTRLPDEDGRRVFRLKIGG